MWRWGRVWVGKNFCIYWDFCIPTYFEIPCLIPGFSCTYIFHHFSVHFLPLHCLSFSPFFQLSIPFLVFATTQLCSLSLFSFYVLFLFLRASGVCFFFGIHAWVVFVLYLTSYMAGFGFWVGSDDCWCASFFDLLFSYPFFSLFLISISTTKLTKKDGGCIV